MGVLNSAAEVVTTIIADPIGFLSNLIDGVAQGLQNFVGNIGTHLQTGLATWLFGEVAKAGIQMPETLDMKGLLELGTQVLGLTWDVMRARAAKLLGDDVVSQLEETFDLFLIIKEQGLGGLWEQIQDQIGDLKETIIGSIGEMVASEVIEAGIQWLIGILGGPAGAFIKAAKAIYDLVMWFVNNGSQMVELVQAVINSVTAIAGGAVGQAAQYVEESLAKAIPVTIGFLASLLGLGDLSSKIKGIIEQAQEPITRAVDWVIGKAQDFAKSLLKSKNKDGKGQDHAKNADLTKEELDAGLAENKKGETGKNAELTKQQRDAGLTAFETEGQKYLSNDTISKKNAEKTGKDVSQKHSVFKSITVIDGGDSWDYEYVFRAKKKKKKKKRNVSPQSKGDPFANIKSITGIISSYTKEEEPAKVVQSTPPAKSDDVVHRCKALLEACAGLKGKHKYLKERLTNIQEEIEQAEPDSREAIAKRESKNLAAIADIIERSQKDKWLDQLFGGAENENDVKYIENNMSKWGVGHPSRPYKSPAHCIVDHANRHKYQNEYLKYLRKSISFKKKGCKSKFIEKCTEMESN